MYRYPLTKVVPAVQRACAAPGANNLRLPRWQDNPNPQAGLCYSASEAVFHLGGQAAGFFPANIPWEDSSHWYLVNEYGTVCDPTVSQFALIPHYTRGVRRGFQTGYDRERCSRRGQWLMREALLDLHTYRLPNIDPTTDAELMA